MESPLLSDDMAPLPDEEDEETDGTLRMDDSRLHLHTVYAAPHQSQSQSHYQPYTSTQQRGSGTSGRGRRALSGWRMAGGSGRRPDVVPSWEEGGPSSPSQASSTASTRAPYARLPIPLPRSTTPQVPSPTLLPLPPETRSRGLQSAILSPVQAVLYGRAEQEGWSEGPFSGYSTFSPRRSPRTTLGRRALDSEDVLHRSHHHDAL